MKLGFIGCGNMSCAMISGIIKNEVLNKEDIIGTALRESTMQKVKDTYGITIAKSNKELVEQCDMIVLAVKPQYYESVILELKNDIREDQVIITIAPGKTLEWMAEKLGKNIKVARSMPNTPAMVGEGMTAVCFNSLVTEEEVKDTCAILGAYGKVEIVDESLMDVVVSVSGSSPAYVYMIIEAMADGAVADGMPRAQAYKFASQAVLGSAKMVLETGIHPGELKDMVCSPGGTTIEAVRVLEEKGLRSAIISAMKACVKKAKGM